MKSGLFLNGVIPSGSFTESIIVDDFGNKMLLDILIDSSLFNVATGKSQELQCVIIDETGKIIKDLGKGIVTCEQFWISNSGIVCGAGKFTKIIDKNLN